MTTPAHGKRPVPTDPEELAAARRAAYGDPPAASPTDLGAYLGLLADALRARGARESEVREVVGEVRAHCRGTGEHPVDAFGLPEAYASARYRPLSPVVVLGRILAGVLGAVGLSAIVLWVLPAFPPTGGSRAVRSGELWGPIGFIVAMSLVPWVVYAVERLLLPRRLTADRPTRGAWVIRGLVVAAFLVVSFVVSTHQDARAADRVLFTLPRWGFLVVGLLLVPFLLLSVPGGRGVPGPPRRGPGPRRTRP